MTQSCGMDYYHHHHHHHHHHHYYYYKKRMLTHRNMYIGTSNNEHCRGI
jgi:hypothetical protein